MLSALKTFLFLFIISSGVKLAYAKLLLSVQASKMIITSSTIMSRLMHQLKRVSIPPTQVRNAPLLIYRSTPSNSVDKKR